MRFAKTTGSANIILAIEHRLAPRTVGSSGPQPGELSRADLMAQLQQLEERMRREDARIRGLVQNNLELKAKMRVCLDRVWPRG
jgi:hypothetical protein